MTPEFLSIAQLSEYSALSKNTLKAWLKRGMPFYRIGKSVRVKRSEFDNWMAENFRPSGTPKRRLKSVLSEVIQEVS